MSQLGYPKMNSLATPVYQTMPELGPSFREFSPELQTRYRLPAAGFTIGIGSTRFMGFSSSDENSWTAITYDSYGEGNLVEVGRLTVSLLDTQVPGWILTESVHCMRDQIDSYPESGSRSIAQVNSLSVLTHQLPPLEHRMEALGATGALLPAMASQTPPVAQLMWAPAVTDYANTPGRIPGFILGVLGMVLLTFAPVFSIPISIWGAVVAGKAVHQIPAGTEGRGLPIAGVTLSIVAGVVSFAMLVIAYNSTFG